MAQTTSGEESRAQRQSISEIEELRTEIAQLREQLLRAESEAALVPELRAALAPRHMPSAQLTPQQRTARAEQTVDQMSKSLSWRVTRPLRALKRRLSG
jgi:hypothetical protein